MARSLQASQQALDDLIDPARIRKHWNQHDQQWADAAGVSLKTLERFWDRELIRRTNFIAICQAIDIEDWGAIADFPPSLPETFVYDPETWVGRDSLLEELLYKLKQQTRLVWLTGISGVGKTTLGECLAVKAWDATNPFDWISYEIPSASENQNFTVSAANLLETYLGDTNLDPQERNDPKRLSDRLLRKLQSRSYWIQLDSIERLLDSESSAFVDEYWLTFLLHCLTQPEFPSRLVLTSQALPASIIEWRTRYPNRWHETTLRGLLVTEQQNERLEFFNKNGIPAERSESWLNRIAEIYEGHPLVLRVIAGEIRQNYNGDVAQYWAVNHQEFEQVARELQGKRLDETEYNDVFDRQVRDRVKKSLEQLPSDALDLLCRSAVYRRPVSRKFWLAMIGNCTSQQQKAAYRVLGDRSLIEKEGTHQGQFLIRQHNLIRDIAYDLLRQASATWETSERKATEMWLSDYETVVDMPDLEKVRGYLEAFYHLSELEAWDEAYEVICICPSEASEEIGVQLGTWGYYREQIEIYSKLWGKLASSPNSICLKNLGVAYRFLDNYAKANEYYDQALNLFLELGQREEGAWILHEVGLIKADQGKDDEAREYYNRALQVFIDLDLHKGIALALNDIARVEVNQGSHAEAIEHYKKSLNIYPESENRTGYAWILYNLGQALSGQEEYTEAQNYINRSLSLFRELENKIGIAWALHGLGNVIFNLGNDEESAYNYTLEALTLFRQLQNQTGIPWTLHVLGKIQFRRGNFKAVGECYQEKILIWKELNNLSGIAFAIEGFARLLTTQPPNKQLLAPYLFGAAEALREAIKYPLPLPDGAEYNLGVDEAKKQVDEAEFLTAWNLGKTTSIDQVIFEILAIENEN